MEGRNDIALVLEKVWIPAAGSPAGPAAEATEPKLNISVIFTSVEATVAALRKAGALAASLGARILLLVPQVVPYPLPLESPPVLLEWNEKRFKAIASQSTVETTVRLYLCRDGFETLKNALGPKSLVVIGGCKRWSFFSREKRLAAKLRRSGHEVIFTEME